MGSKPRNYSVLRNFGGGKRDRTADLLHAMQALSQLSYTPYYFAVIRELRFTGILNFRASNYNLKN